MTRSPATPPRGRRAGPLAALLGAALLLLGGTASAQPAGELLRRAVSAHDNADFTKALELFRDALARPGVSRDQQVEAFRYVASAQVALGQEDEARRALRRLLTLSPAYRFPGGTAPKILLLLEEVRGTLPRLEHRPERDLQPGPPVVLSVQAGSLPPGAVINAYVRYSADDRFAPVRMTPTRTPDRFRAVLPDPPARLGQAASTGLEYYVQVEPGGGAASGEALAAVGEPGQPLRMLVAFRTRNVPVPAEPTSTPWYKRWWPWAIVGAVVAGAVIGGVLGSRAGDTATPVGPTQQVVIRFGN